MGNIKRLFYLNETTYFQKSFLGLLATNKRCEKFFKVFYERMRAAQAEIKATVTVNTGDQLGGTSKTEDLQENKDQDKKKGIRSSLIKEVLCFLTF